MTQAPTEIRTPTITTPTAPTAPTNTAPTNTAPTNAPTTAAARAATVRLGLLGGFSLRSAHQLVEVRVPAQRLLAFVALQRGRPASRISAAENLWPDVDPRHAAGNLRATMCRLPKPGGTALIASTATHLRLVPEMTVDLWDSESATHELAGDRERPSADLLSAEASCGDLLVAGGPRWSLLSHDLLPDWFEDWLLLDQESHRQTRLHALELLSRAMQQRGDLDRALAAGLAAVGSEPLRESAHRRVIEVHLAEGNAAEALRQYQLFRRLLADELGLPPSPVIRRLVAPLLGRPLDQLSA